MLTKTQMQQIQDLKLMGYTKTDINYYRSLHGCRRRIDLHTLDKSDEEVFNTVYYKEILLLPRTNCYLFPETHSLPAENPCPPN